MEHWLFFKWQNGPFLILCVGLIKLISECETRSVSFLTKKDKHFAMFVLKSVVEYTWCRSLFEKDDKYSDHILDWNGIGDLWIHLEKSLTSMTRSCPVWFIWHSENFRCTASLDSFHVVSAVEVVELVMSVCVCVCISGGYCLRRRGARGINTPMDGNIGNILGWAYAEV